MTSLTLDYGKCRCAGQLESRSVEIRMTLEHGLVALTNVPQGACPVCGSRVYKAWVLQCIEGVYQGANPGQDPEQAQA